MGFNSAFKVLNLSRLKLIFIIYNEIQFVPHIEYRASIRKDNQR